MASGYDRDFNAEKAKIWKAEVENELIQVSSILKKVNDLCASDPVDGDPILEKFIEVNDVLQKGWTELEKGFKAVIKGLDDIIQDVLKTIQENIEKIDVFKEKAKKL
ncbi:hypothetical protein [Massilimicrobiota timonensis]|uniref:hypothetical protein n=1 Tax=Massilimicrobiota timonensis TaxID=1776392 RepID=UPI00195F5A99|nr:hypothetical protein [Massilimicrobiota timonensis]MBM6967129.1 hypothetical protein [Massilimicrobiota timonensis]